MAETIKVRFVGAGPQTVGHVAWYPGETWTVDQATWQQLQAQGVPVCLLEPMPETETATAEPEPEPKPKRKGKQA